MEQIITYLTDKYHGCMRYWWLPIVLGILVIITGLIVFIFPKLSYLTLSLLFGILIMISGIFYIIMSSSKTVRGKGWLLASGIIELILGILLTIWPSIAILSLPYFLAFWLMFKGFTLLGVGSDMSDVKNTGWGWTIFSALLLILCSFIIIAQPIAFGIEAVILWIGISLLIGGISIINFGIQIKRTSRQLNAEPS